MAGFSVDATGQKVMFTDNVDYSGAATPTGQFTANGQLAIGSLVAPHIRINTLTASPGISITNGNGTISIGPNIITANTTVQFAVSGNSLKQDFGLSNLGIGSSYPAITSGVLNVSVGNSALSSISTGSQNTAIGNGALATNAVGLNNTAVGYHSLNQALSTSSTAVGYLAAAVLGSGAKVTVMGDSALVAAVTTQNDVAIGYHSMLAYNGTGNNLALGFSSLDQLTTGTTNIAIGKSAGTSYTGAESNNIIIGNSGTASESNVIRIGTQGSGAGQQNATFIAGIAGVTVSNTNLVAINTSTGQLGSQALSTGTFTPTLVGNSVAGTTTYTSQNGYYTQIGNIVTVIGTINYTAATGTGNMLIGGLPFTIKNQTQGNTMGSVLVSSAGTAWPAGTTSTVLYGQLNTTTAEIYCTGSSSAGGFMQMANTSGGITFTMTYQV